MSAGRPAPRLETERLILRETRAEDVEACAGLWRGERVVRHIGGAPSTPSEAGAPEAGWVLSPLSMAATR